MLALPRAACGINLSSVGPIALNGTKGPQSTRFGYFPFYEGGQVNLEIQALPLKAEFLISQKNSTTLTFQPGGSGGLPVGAAWLLICREDASFSYDTITTSAKLDADVCGKLTDTLFAVQCPVIRNFPRDANERNVSLAYTIENEGYYSAFAVVCNATFVGRLVAGSMTNPGPWFFRHLSAVEIPILKTYMAFIGIWTIVMVVWMVHLYRMWHMANLLFMRLTALPVLMLVYSVLSIWYYVHMGVIGNKSDVLDTVRFLMLITNLIVLYAMLQLLSKGWFIVRKRLAPVEKRTIGGMSLFVSLGNIFFQYIGGGAVIAMIVFAATVYLYMFWNLRFIIDSLTDYLRTLRDRLNSVDGSFSPREPIDPQTPWVIRYPTAPSRAGTPASSDERRRGWWAAKGQRVLRSFFPPPPSPPPATAKFSSLGSDWQLLHSYCLKLWLLSVVHRIVVYFATGTFLILCIQSLTQNYSYAKNAVFEYPYVGVILNQGFLFLGIVWIGVALRLRDPTQYVVVPAWVAGSGRRQNTPRTL
ncbi:hypothetical protein HDU96_005711 [Phlyctochytrium bullatum]|nr:hypothetical protein HDU96_005711 [Phlyctochytrium bullatum]